MSQKTKPFLCHYYHDGSRWALVIHAYDLRDAEARCKKLWLNFDGEIMAVIPAKIGIIAKAICFARNTYDTLKKSLGVKY